MARVPMNDSLIHAMSRKAMEMFERDYPVLPAELQTLDSSIADSIYNMVFPINLERQAKALLPSWLYNESDHVSALFRAEGATARTYAVGTMTEKRMVLREYTAINHLSGNKIYNVPGIKEITVGTGSFSLLIGDTGAVTDIALREYLDKVKAFCVETDAAQNKARTAYDDMETFLRQHTTLQTAVKEFGPALLQFCPLNVVNVYDRPEPKPTPKPKKEKVKVNTEYLVAKATIDKLQLNTLN